MKSSDGIVNLTKVYLEIHLKFENYRIQFGKNIGFFPPYS